jgi:uncharacterized protein
MNCLRADDSHKKTWAAWFLEPIEQANAQQQSGDPAKNTKAWCGLVGAVGCLLFLRFFFLQNEQYRLVLILEFLQLHSPAEQLSVFISDPLGRLATWAAGCVLCYFFIPAIMIRFLFKEKLASHGFRLASFSDTLMFVFPSLFFMAPLVFLASTQPHFLNVYPFYDPPPGGGIGMDFLIWELMYAMQFIALEFFFRGFMVHCLTGVAGAWAIPIMVMPYCMIHFQKPFPEATASIIAGLALGWLGLKTRSIVPGAVLHISVAWAMDATSLFRKGYFN